MIADYKCMQDELITGLYVVRNNLVTEIVTFSGKKAMYDAAFVAAFTAAIKAADDAPDEHQRRAENDILKNKLSLYFIAEQNALVRAPMEEKLGDLRTYIRTAWPNDVDRKIRMMEAGYDVLEKVMDGNWDVVQGMMNTTKEFINTHETALLMGGANMPATFKAGFDALADLIIADAVLYVTTKTQIPTMTQEKIRLCNIAFAMGMEICKDGQEYFKQNPAKRNTFTWVNIMEAVTPPGAAGLRGSVKESGSNYPIEAAMIEMQTATGTPIMFETDVDGKYYSGSLPAGDYSFKLSKAGFATIESEVEIKTGVTSYKHWLMSVGGGEEIELEGLFDAGAIRNIDFGDVDVEDASIRLDAVGTTVSYFASSSPTGGQTGPVVTVNSGVPVLMKLSVFIAMIGLNGVNSFLNAQNIGSGSGGWKVTVIIA